LRLAPEEHVLLRTIHHIIFDGWSHTVFMRELGALYDAFSMGNPSPLLDLPVQYADFAQSQRQWLQDEVLSDQLDYWQQQLSGNVAPLELPIDYPRSTSVSYRGASQSLELSESLTDALKTLSSQQGVTLFVTLLTAFKTLLYQYTQQQDILICSPVAGRHRTETRGLIGYFNNVVVMRTDLSGNPTLQNLLERVSQVSIGAYEHQDAPFQKVAELPNLLRIPLTRAIFILYNAPSPFSGFLPHTLELTDLRVNSQFINRDIANFDLSLLMQEQDKKLTAVLQYKSDLFAVSSIRAMLDNFQSLLASLIANPDQCLTDLPVLGQRPELLVSNSEETNSLPRSKEAFVAPRNDLELQLQQIWEDVLGVNSVGIRDNFFDVGGHSLLAARLFAKIEQAFHKNLPLSTLFQAPTIEQLADVICQEESSAPWSSLVAIRATGSKPPLFCVHGGGFNILIYQDLANYLGPDYPVYGLQAQGLDGTAVLHGSFEEMAADYIKQMQTVQPNGPYLLGGVSNGGTIALEMAQQLRAQGHQVALLAMFDTYGPDNFFKVLPPIPRLFSVLEYAARFTIPRFVAKRLQNGLKPLIADIFKEMKNANQWIDDDQNSQAVTKQLEREGMTDGTGSLAANQMGFFEHWVHKLNMWIIERSQLSYLAPQAEVHGLGGTLADAVKKLEAVHLQARLNYIHHPYHGLITVFRAKEQPPGFYRDPQFGWGSIAAGGLEIYDIPGYHTDVVQSPVLAEKMKICIDKALKIAL
jgi:thioesterase domain-containing protein/acyl carrier protein